MCSDHPSARPEPAPLPLVFSHTSKRLYPSSQLNPVDAFDLFTKTYGKTYVSHGEKAKRLDIFKSNAALIAKKNAAQSSLRLALNEFADLTWEEFSAKRLGYRAEEHSNRLRMPQPFTHANVSGLPASIDWRKEGAVNEVKDQVHLRLRGAFLTAAVLWHIQWEIDALVDHCIG